MKKSQTPVSRSEASSASQPRWKTRALQRQHLLNNSLSTRVVSTQLRRSIGDFTSYDQPHYISTSTSPHHPESTASPTHILLPSPTSTFTSQSRLDSSSNDFYSRASLSIDSTCRTSSSWLTCSESDPENRSAMEFGLPSIKATALPNNGNKPPNQVKLLDVMLSAIDRKKKNALPKEKATAPAATLAPSADSRVSMQASSESSSRKLQARGAAERQDFTLLRAFLNDSPATAEDRLSNHEPKSYFDWEDGDSDSDSEVSNSVRYLKRLRKSQPAQTSAKQQGEGTRESISEESVTGNGGTLSISTASPDIERGCGGRSDQTSGGMLNALDHITERCPLNDVDDGKDGKQEARKALEEVFDGPLWDHTSATTSSTGQGSDLHSITKTSATNTETGSSRTGTTTTKPLLAVSTKKKDARPKLATISHMSPAGFPLLNYTQYDRDTSAKKALERAPGATPNSRVDRNHKSRSDIGFVEKPSMLKKLKSQFGVHQAPIVGIKDEPRRRSPLTAGPIELEGSSVPNSKSYLKWDGIASDLSKSSAADLFVDRGSPHALKGPAVFKSGEKVSRFNEHVDSPSEEYRSQKDVSKEEEQFELARSPKSPLPQNTTTSLLTPSSSSSAADKSLMGGLPKGPWDPEWDDAVKWVKRSEKGREAREAKEAREQKKEDKRLKKLKAGKDVVKRGSQLGLMLRKPVEDLTEDEFELVGSAATSPHKDSSVEKKSGVLGALFTKMRGTKQEQTVQSRNIGRQLDNHTSLHLLNVTALKDINGPTLDDRAHYDKALQLLNGQGYEETNLINPFEPDHDDSATVLGLGITSIEPEQLAGNDEAPAHMHYNEPDSTKQTRGNEHSSLEDCPEEQDLTKSTETAEDDGSQNSIGRPMSTIAEADSDESGSNNITNRRSHANASSVHQDSTSPSTTVCGFDKEMSDDSSSMSTSSVYSFDAAAMPAPLNIPVVRVARSSQHLQPSNSKSFIPRRNGSFHDKIQFASRLQQLNLSDHPALRDGEASMSSLGQSNSNGDQTCASSNSDNAQIDSGIAIKTDDVEDEGYVSGTVNQHEFDLTESHEHGRGLLLPHQSTLAEVENTGGRISGDVDIQALREAVGIDAIKLPSSPQSPQHPSHPFTWSHEKIMCRGVHNPPSLQPRLPDMPPNVPVQLSRMDSQYFKGNSPNGDLIEAKTCESCGVFCCRFANLVNASKIATSKDVAEETVRLKAEERVKMLRTYHPNGIEEYDTFLTCMNCDSSVCPSCAKKCMESLCQATVCKYCAKETDVCPVHNDAEA